MIIDVFCHHISESVGKMMHKSTHYGEGKEFPYPPQNADPEARLGLEAGEFFIRENLACVKAMPIPDDEKRKILGENAKRLLKIT